MGGAYKGKSRLAKMILNEIEEKNLPFATQYEVYNSKKGTSEIFQFSHTTGSDWDPNTKSIYYCELKGDFVKGLLPKKITLSIGNDPELTKKRAASYLHHKLKN